MDKTKAWIRYNFEEQFKEQEEYYEKKIQLIKEEDEKKIRLIKEEDEKKLLESEKQIQALKERIKDLEANQTPK